MAEKKTTKAATAAKKETTKKAAAPKKVAEVEINAQKHRTLASRPVTFTMLLPLLRRL